MPDLPLSDVFRRMLRGQAAQGVRVSVLRRQGVQGRREQVQLRWRGVVLRRRLADQVPILYFKRVIYDCSKIR